MKCTCNGSGIIDRGPREEREMCVCMDEQEFEPRETPTLVDPVAFAATLKRFIIDASRREFRSPK